MNMMDTFRTSNPDSRVRLTSARAISWRSLLAPLTAAGLMTTLAGNALSQQFSPMVTVSPLTATPGVSRTITLGGSWPNACTPASATLLPAVAGVSGISIRLNAGVATAGCEAAPATAYTLSVTVAPAVPGVQPVWVSLPTGALIGQGTLVTDSSGQTRSARDLSGAWSDPATNGSGLAISHSHTGSDLLAGSLYVYNLAGFPTWLLIQNAQWQSPTKLKADLVLFRGSSATCSISVFPSVPGCPKPAVGSGAYGLVDIELLANGQLKLDAFTRPNAVEFSFTPLFSATFSRLLF